MKIPDRNKLIALAGERAFRRGEEYFIWGRVRALAADAGKISALVDGRQSYQVSLWSTNSRIKYECTCPVGEAGDFCKHSVAVCLAVMHQETLSVRSDETHHILDLRNCIESLPREELVAVALGEAMHSVRLRERLRLRAARAGGKTTNLEEYRAVILHAVESLLSTETASAGRAIPGEAESVLTLLLEEGWTDAVLTLTGEALVLVANQRKLTDSLSEFGQRLFDFHFEGCRRQMIAPAELATRLLDLQMQCRIQEAADVLGDVEGRYARLLGDEGTLVYRQLLIREWREACAGAGHGAPEQKERFARLSELAIHSAERHNDLRTLISVKSHLLQSAEDYLELVHLCKTEGDRDVALEWAWMGKGRFNAPEVARLDAFLIAEYEDRAEWNEALEVVFTRFTAEPSLGGYQKIAELAERLGTREQSRDRALQAVREITAESLSTPYRRAGRRSGKETLPDRSVLVSILLWENDEEAAWQAVQQGDCDDELWLALAGRRANKHPEDSLAVYRRLVTRDINRKNNYAYRHAIELLHRIGRIMRKQKRREEFIEYVNQLRHTHRSQYNFAKLVDQMMARYYPSHQKRRR